ncbi:MAG: DUF4384 domain-containing protein [Gemmatimonadota bacterium]|nr:DUF4384 domain-containing protein [Gemmatimonadota bacterium]
MYARNLFTYVFGCVLGLVTSVTVAGPALAESPFSPALIPASAGYGGTRIWLESEPGFYRFGDRLDIRYSVPRDSYVAIIHIDGDGSLDFLYPDSPRGNHFVRGGRTHRLTLGGRSAANLINTRQGIGYLYIIASPEPFDFRQFYGLNRGWGWDYAGRSVYGDPFLALEQITHLLIPRWRTVRYSYDYHSYYVGGVHRYPGYACGNRRPGSGWGWTVSYGPCGSGIEIFLRENPYYYDTVRYAGDRRVYLARLDRYDPRSGNREPPAPVVRNAVPRNEEERRAGEVDQARTPTGSVPSRPAPSAGGVRQPGGAAVARPSTGPEAAREPGRTVPAPEGRASGAGSGAAPAPGGADRRAATRPEEDESARSTSGRAGEQPAEPRSSPPARDGRSSGSAGSSGSGGSPGVSRPGDSSGGRAASPPRPSETRGTRSVR